MIEFVAGGAVVALLGKLISKIRHKKPLWETHGLPLPDDPGWEIKNDLPVHQATGVLVGYFLDRCSVLVSGAMILKDTQFTNLCEEYRMCIILAIVDRRYNKHITKLIEDGNKELSRLLAKTTETGK